MKIKPTRPFALSAIAVIFLLRTVPVTGQLTTYYWTNTTGVNAFYDVSANWSPNGVPIGSSKAVFAQDAIYQVTWDSIVGNRTLNRFELAKGEVSFVNLTNTLYYLGVTGNSTTDVLVDFGGAGAFSPVARISGLSLSSVGGARIGAKTTFLSTTIYPTLWVDGNHPAGSVFSVSGLSGLEIEGTLKLTSGGDANVTSTRIGGLNLGGGDLLVSGAGSTFTNSYGMQIGVAGSGTANVTSGGTITSLGITVGHAAGDSGVLNITGAGSSATVTSANNFVVGENGTGAVNLNANSTLATNVSFVGYGTGSTGTVTLQGSSTWNESAGIYVGNSGNGTVNVQSGSTVSCNALSLGAGSSGTGTATVSGTGSSLAITNELSLGLAGIGNLNINSGGLVQVGGLTNLNKGSLSISGANSTLSSSNVVTIGRDGNANVNVASGGSLTSSSFFRIGYDSGDTGTVSIAGTGSTVSTAGSFYLGYGFFANGFAHLNSNAVLSTGNGEIGAFSIGAATLQNNSTWNSTGDITVGASGAGTLLVLSGSDVSSTNGWIGKNSGSTGQATVDGAGSSWIIANDLIVSNFGTGTLHINSGGLVQVGGTTAINSAGSVQLNGGTFSFGQTSDSSLARVTANSGTLLGTVNNSQYRSAGSLTSLVNLANSPVNFNGVVLSNTGTVYGQATLGSSLANQATGEVEVLAGERMRFAGTSPSTNAGEINNFGGIIRFDGAMQNQSSGFIAGRGQFIANGGWTNNGSMAFSGGVADVLGDVNNVSGSLIVTTGGATTTFFDDVVNNGTIRTSQNSSTVILGSASGSGNYTGTGTVYMEGDLRPGNSPGIVSFGGDLVFGSSAESFFEIGGLIPGMFDQLQIAGDLFLGNSTLNVSFLKGFTVNSSEKFRFLIASVGGTVNGQFSGLSEGARLGSTDLYITYLGFGAGNGIGLYTSDKPRLWSDSGTGFSAVPEPTSFVLMGWIVLGVTSRRNRRKMDQISF